MGLIHKTKCFEFNPIECNYILGYEQNGYCETCFIEEEQREAVNSKSFEVNKHLEAKIDLGYLLCSDPNDLDEKRLKYVQWVQLNYTVCVLLFCIFLIYRTDKEQYLADLTRDNVQLIVNQLWEQPTERVEECVVARLPAPSFVLPRSRKCPVPRPLTKWEQYAQEKGIKKAKKDKKVFDEELDVRKFW